jgi:beta-carotene ketolase (CrtW type)
LFAYAFFDYDKLKSAHAAHHRAPASEHDPDFHAPGAGEAFWPWYRRFMLGYMTWRQWIGMPIVFWTLWLACRAPLANVLCFWAAPAILSTFQLFYFGTYLPHRTPAEGHRDEHRATTSGFSRWWSFLTCYHFGKHWEHHAYPYIPWWKLGKIADEMKNAGARGSFAHPDD